MATAMRRRIGRWALPGAALVLGLAWVATAPAGTLQRTKEAPRKLEPVGEPQPPPRAEEREPTKPGRLRPLRKPEAGPPGATPDRDAARPDVQEVDPGPLIKSVTFTPGSIGHVGGQIFAPGGTITVQGAWIGEQPGTLHLEVNGAKFPDYPAGRIDLQNVQWLGNERARGRIPPGMTGPLHRAWARVVLTRADGRSSPPFSGHFEVPVETKILSHSDPAVRTLSCDGTVCTPGSADASDVTLGGSIVRSGTFTPGLFGADHFAIDLTDGWVFSRVVDFERTLSGDDDDYIGELDPPVQEGEDHWAGGVGWYISGDDHGAYQVRIEVKRAKGAW